MAVRQRENIQAIANHKFLIPVKKKKTKNETKKKKKEKENQPKRAGVVE